MIEIKSWRTGQVLFRLEGAEDRKQAVENAVKTGADLRGADLRDAVLTSADLRGADLTSADLRGADLTGAVLTGADLTGAVLTGADLRGADLRDAVLTGADLRGADLTGAVLTGADLRDADLRGADLRDAVLTGADLRDADLTPIYQDFLEVLVAAPAEVVGLRAALVEGRVDGSCYEGDCACLIGTLAKVKHCKYDQLPGLKPDSGRPIECLFMAIRPGQTPADNPVSAIVVGWIDRFLGAAALACGPPEQSQDIPCPLA